MWSKLFDKYTLKFFSKNSIKDLVLIASSAISPILLAFVTLFSYQAFSHERQVYKPLQKIGFINRKSIDNALNRDELKTKSLIGASFSYNFIKVGSDIDVKEGNVVSLWHGEHKNVNSSEYTTFCSGAVKQIFCRDINIGDKVDFYFNNGFNGLALFVLDEINLISIDKGKISGVTVIYDHDNRYDAKDVVTSNDLHYVFISYEHEYDRIFYILEKNSNNIYKQRTSNKNSEFSHNSIQSAYKPSLCSKKTNVAISNNGVLACESEDGDIFISVSKDIEYKIASNIGFGDIKKINITDDGFVVVFYNGGNRKHSLAVWHIQNMMKEFVYFDSFNLYSSDYEYDNLLTKVCPEKSQVLLADRINDLVVVKDLRKLYVSNESVIKNSCFSEKIIPTNMFVEDAFFSSTSMNSMVALFGEETGYYKNKKIIELWRLGCEKDSAILLGSVSVRNYVQEVVFNMDNTQMLVSYKKRVDLYDILSYDGGDLFDQLHITNIKQNELFNRVNNINKRQMDLIEKIYKLDHN